MSELLEWGVPDWQRAELYPDPTGRPAAMLVWAWEFLRRNEQFRSFWRNKVEPFIADDRVGRDHTGRFWPYYKEMQESFGIQDPVSPRQNSIVPAFCDLGMSYVLAPAVSYELPDVADQVEVSPLGLVRPSRANLSKEEIQKSATLSLEWFEMGVAIDLRFPIDDQLKAIGAMAKQDQLTLQKAGQISGPRPVKASKKYILYLRLLDAEDGGAKRAHIEEVLFPNVANRYPERRRSKALDNALAEARRLRDSGYRALAYRAKVPMTNEI